MKSLKLIAFLLVIPITFNAQTLTGLWTGSLTNDSNTVRRDQSFEIILSQYKDKVTGYSRMTFFVQDTLYYIVKRVKGTIEGDVCEVKDDEILKHNFPVKPEKGVKLITTFRRSLQDSVWRLDGNWRTTESKKHAYYAISGKLSLKSEPDLEHSRLIPHLEELKVADDIIAQYREARSKKEAEALALATKSKQQTQLQQPAKPVETGIPADKLPTVAETEKKDIPIAAKEQPETKEMTVAAASPAVSAANKVGNEPAKEGVAVKSQPFPGVNKPVLQPETKKNNETVAKAQTQPPVVAAPVPGDSKTVSSRPLAKVPEQQKTPAGQDKTPGAIAGQEKNKDKEMVVTPALPVEKRAANTVESKLPEIPPIASAPRAATAVIHIEERKVAAQQTVYFKSDSLELALYDNGEVDGDTVSILFNGEVIMAHQGLKATAIRKTIYVPAGQTDSLTLVLYAENLGRYPPNTGLLVIHDGEDVYQVRFSADLKQNAGVIFKRKTPVAP